MIDFWGEKTLAFPTQMTVDDRTIETATESKACFREDGDDQEPTSRRDYTGTSLDLSLPFLVIILSAFAARNRLMATLASECRPPFGIPWRQIAMGLLHHRFWRGIAVLQRFTPFVAQVPMTDKESPTIESCVPFPERCVRKCQSQISARCKQ
jgi:hypothetical protein